MIWINSSLESEVASSLPLFTVNWWYFEWNIFTIHFRCPVWNSVVGCLCTNTKYMYFEISSENGLMELWCHANCVSTQIKWNQSAYMIQLIVRLILWDTPLLQPPRYAKPFLFQFPYLSIALVSTKRVCELAMLPSTSSSS